MEKASLCLDPSGVLRGQCQRCAACRGWSFRGGQKIRFKPEDTHAASNSTGAGGLTPCENCGCPANAHEDLEDWLRSARRWVHCLRSSDGAWPEQAPPTACLPAEARRWSPEAAAIHIVTGAQFEPSRDGRGQWPQQAGGEDDLVSVVCTTLEKDQPSHGLLYECFRRQTYEPRELVVVDSGTSPSHLLMERAAEDPRVVYRFFFREEHGLEQAEDPYERVLRQDDPDDIIEWTEYVEEMPDMDRAEVRWEGLSLGLKRNIACHLARGASIMHFNVNALYAPDYLTVMHHKLMAEVAQQARWQGKPSMGARIPVAVTLAEWHALDFDDEEARLVDTDRRGAEVPEVKRQQVQYGKGFTYTYTRSCWELAPFPDVEEPEGRLAKVLKRKSVPLKLVRRPPGQDAVVALGYMRESSSGESATANINLSMEIQLLEMCSSSVYLPRALLDLVRLTREVVSTVKSKQKGGLTALLQAEGACFLCVHCDAAIALRRYLKTVRKLGDGAGGKVEIAQFSRAGGAVAEGVEATYEEPPGRRARQPVCGQAPRRRRAPAPSALGRSPAAGGGQQPDQPLPGRLARGCCVGGQALGDGRRARPPGPNRTTGFQSHRVQALAAQARALGRSLQQGRTAGLQQGLTAGGALGTAEPEPEDAAWFPGWWRRNAACRQCGQNIGWRYENRERAIFWVLEAQALKEREPDPQPPAACTRKETLALPLDPLPSQSSPRPTEQPGLTWKEEPPLLTAPSPKTDPKVFQKDAREELPQKPQAAEPPQKPGGQTAKADKSLETGRKAIQVLSSELQQHLARSLTVPDKAQFDQALNVMKLDDATRKNLLQELRIRPGVAATQVEYLVAKSFKGKVNTLRSLGLRLLRAALQLVDLPEDTLQRLAEMSRKDGTGSEPMDAEPASTRRPGSGTGCGADSGMSKAGMRGSGPACPEQPPAGAGAGKKDRPAPVPVPEEWEVEWSEACQCYQYYDEDGRLVDEPTGHSGGQAAAGGRICSEVGLGSAGIPQEADLR